jgi:hypothetical protein
MASPKNMQDVLERSTAGRGDQTNSLGIRAWSAFACSVKKPFGLQLGLHGFKGQLKGSHAIQLHRSHNQLILTSWCIERNIASQDEPNPLGQLIPKRDSFTSEEDTGELGMLVFEGEVTMTRSLKPKIADLAADSNRLKPILQQAGYLPSKTLDSPGTRGFGRRRRARRNRFVDGLVSRFDWIGWAGLATK